MKKVLVTGGVRGIGRAVAEAFLQKGYTVFTAYEKDEKSAQEMREKGAIAVKANVACSGDVDALFQAVGTVDILVNNAGVALVKQVQDTTEEEYDKVFDVNMKGVFLCTKKAVAGMLKKGGGLIVNVSSVWGELGGSMESVYSASKAAVIGFTKALSKEVGFSGVRVNCVSPGVVDTDMNACFSSAEKDALASEIPLGRMGTAEEIAKAVLFMEENEYINGTNLSVNGGFFA